MKNYRFIIYCIFLLVISCGDVSIEDNANKDPNQVDASLTKIPDTTPSIRGQSDNVYTFIGSVESEVNIPENSIVFFSRDENGHVPVFNNSFSAGKGAVIIGGAVFKGPLIITGTQATPITWQATAPISLENSSRISWAEFSGENSIEILATSGDTSIVNTIFHGSGLSANIDKAILNIANTSFNNSRLEINLGVGDDTKQVKFNLTNFNQSPINFSPKVDLNKIEITACNFLNLKKDSDWYISNIPEGEFAKVVEILAINNYFKHRKFDIVNGVSDVVKSLRENYVIREPFLAGPGSDNMELVNSSNNALLNSPTFSFEGSKDVYVYLYGNYHNIGLNAIIKNAIKQELPFYGISPEIKFQNLNLLFTPQVECLQSYYCTFPMNLNLELSVIDENNNRLKRYVTVLQFEPRQVYGIQLMIHSAVLNLIGQAVGDNILALNRNKKPVLEEYIQSPYF